MSLPTDIVLLLFSGVAVYAVAQFRETGKVPVLNLFPDLLAVDAGLEAEDFPAGVSSVKVWPRGIRNNNPTNIRHTGTRWQGLANPPSDGAFCRFINVRYGIRAAAKIFKSYSARGLVSVEDIIKTWAPDSENNTTSYIFSVAQRTGLDINRPLQQNEWPLLIEAIIYHENGEQPYPMKTIIEGVNLA